MASQCINQGTTIIVRPRQSATTLPSFAPTPLPRPWFLATIICELKSSSPQLSILMSASALSTCMFGGVFTPRRDPRTGGFPLAPRCRCAPNRERKRYQGQCIQILSDRVFDLKACLIGPLVAPHLISLGFEARLLLIINNLRSNVPLFSKHGVVDNPSR